jgi:AcrR family transcriptional regulator
MYSTGTTRYPQGMDDASLVAAHPRLEPLLDGRAPGQRARLLEAITQAVFEKGYTATTVADVVRAARVSRGTFYALFPSKEACFLEAYRHGVDVLVERVGTAAREAPSPDWRERLRAALGAYLRALADEPRFARTYLLEIHAAGAGAQAERDAALQRFAGRYRTSFDAALRDRPDRSMPSDESLFILAAGVDGLVCARVRVGAVERLPELEDELTFTAVALLEGAAAARADGPPAAGDASHDRRGP